MCVKGLSVLSRKGWPLEYTHTRVAQTHFRRLSQLLGGEGRFLFWEVGPYPRSTIPPENHGNGLSPRCGPKSGRALQLHGEPPVIGHKG